MESNKNRKVDYTFWLRVALIIGIVALSYNDKDGWGWLVFILFCTM